jgi:hypothetical protein
LCAVLEGDVEVTSEVGKGSTFSLSFPVSPTKATFEAHAVV